jgi:LuxR family maltose regulon positive regulatory protein
MNGCAYGMDDLARCELAYYKGDPDNAEKYAGLALSKARERRQVEIENRVFFYLLCINLYRGNYEGIREIFKLLDAQLAVTEYLNRYTNCDIVFGWFYAQIGQPGKIASWLKSDFEETELNSLLIGPEILVRVKWYISQKRYPAALASLESQKQPYGLGGFLFGKITIKILEAVCRYRLDETEEALRILTDAYVLAEPNGLDMPFIELGKAMRSLTAAALKEQNCGVPRAWLEKIRRNSSAYAKKIFGVAEKFRENSPGKQSSQELLSAREMDVLIGLSQGLTREEIASNSVISVNTVKSAIKSVYNKLRAVNRADAVRIATLMGILKGENP